MNKLKVNHTGGLLSTHPILDIKGDGAMLGTLPIKRVQENSPLQPAVSRALLLHLLTIPSANSC